MECTKMPFQDRKDLLLSWREGIGPFAEKFPSSDLSI